MQNYVISLKTEDKRREHINNEFGQQNIQFDFFDALTPNLAIFFAKKLKIKTENQSLTKGELACFMSHVSLWIKMKDENIPYMAIFEDDIFLGKNANYYLNQTQWIDTQWNLIKLEAFAPKVFLGKRYKKFEIDGRTIYKLKERNLGTAGYILSLKCAKILINYVQSVEHLPALDHLMFEDIIKHNVIEIVQMQPALCIQEMILLPSKNNQKFESKLAVERKKRMHSQKKKGFNKVKLEITRLITQFRTVLFAKKSFFN